MRFRRVLASLLAIVALGACGTDGGSTAPPQTTVPPSTMADAAPAFPVTIDHKYGRTEIPKAPVRVVTAGFNEHDFVLALGVRPVAVRDWFGSQPYATWPWARDELGDAKPQVLPSGELNFEQIAALRPDLIVSSFSGMTQQEYETLSRIAPTVAQPGDYVDYGVPWQEQTRLIGRALGRQQRAEDLVAEVESRFAQARAEHPEFQGATGVVGLIGGRAADYHAYGPQDLRARFMRALGFELPPQVAGLAGDSFFTTISREQLTLVEADTLIWIVNSPAVEKKLREDALYQNLRVAKEGRDLFLNVNDPIAGALSFSTVLSLRFALDRLVPMLAAAADGNPATHAAPSS